MTYSIRTNKRVIDIFEQALDDSIATGVERFGLCLYDPKAMRIISAVPTECFKDHNYGHGHDFVRPDAHLMQQIKGFNRVKALAFTNDLPNGIESYELTGSGEKIVLYHTHPDEEQDLFSSIGAGGDTDFSFVEHRLPLDIVVSANARSCNMRPPVCATMNTVYTPFDYTQSYAQMSFPELIALDREKGMPEGTHALLAMQEGSRKEHMCIDFLIE